MNIKTTQINPATDVAGATAFQAGMGQMSAKFRELGGKVYVGADKT